MSKQKKRISFLFIWPSDYIKSRKQKEVGTSFVLLCQSRTMIGRLMKTYLHRPTKTAISHTRENSKMFNITSKYFSFFNNMSPAS